MESSVAKAPLEIDLGLESKRRSRLTGTFVIIGPVLQQPRQFFGEIRAGVHLSRRIRALSVTSTVFLAIYSAICDIAMHLTSLPDFGAGYFIAALGVIALLVWAIPALFIEALLLWSLLPGSRALYDSFVVNLVTTLIGYAIGSRWYLVDLYPLLTRLAGLEGYYDVGPHTGAFFLIVLLIQWVLSVLIEGLLLTWLEPGIARRRIWLSSLSVNAASYIVAPSLLVLSLGLAPYVLIR